MLWTYYHSVHYIFHLDFIKNTKRVHICITKYVLSTTHNSMGVRHQIMLDSPTNQISILFSNRYMWENLNYDILSIQLLKNTVNKKLTIQPVWIKLTLSLTALATYMLVYEVWSTLMFNSCKAHPSFHTMIRTLVLWCSNPSKLQIHIEVVSFLHHNIF